MAFVFRSVSSVSIVRCFDVMAVESSCFAGMNKKIVVKNLCVSDGQNAILNSTVNRYSISELPYNYYGLSNPRVLFVHAKSFIHYTVTHRIFFDNSERSCFVRAIKNIKHTAKATEHDKKL